MTKLEDRVTRVEREVDEVRRLASGAHEDVGAVQAALRAHIDTLEALNENQVEMRKDIKDLRKDHTALQNEVHEGFAEMREGFTKVQLGMAEMTALLNIAIGRDPATD